MAGIKNETLRLRTPVDFHSYVRSLKKRWRIIPACMLVMLALAVAITATTPKTYASKVRFFVSTVDDSDSMQLAQGGTFTQDRVKSYTELIKTPKVLKPIANQLQIKGGSDEIQPLITAKSAAETVIIDAIVTDKSSNRATALAKALGQEFPKAINDLERVSENKPSPVKVTVVQEPADKAEQVGPKWALNLPLAALLGLALGIGLALLRDRLDTKVRTREDVHETAEDLTVLGSIPFDADAPKHPLALATDGQSGRSESFRSLRTNLQFVDAAEHPHVIVVTSSLAGEGKSTTTANLAYAIAESGSSVCLIEADLRRPRLLRYLGLEGGVGLTDVLIGRASLRDVVQRYGDHRLMVLGAGATPPNPSELLGSAAMKDVLADLRKRFDYVIIDAPPLLPVTDAAVLSRVCDGAVIVAGSGIVKREQFLAAVDSLESVGGNILGVVVNRVPRGERSNYYDYRYEYSDAPERGMKRLGLSRRAKKESGK